MCFESAEMVSDASYQDQLSLHYLSITGEIAFIVFPLYIISDYISLHDE